MDKVPVTENLILVRELKAKLKEAFDQIYLAFLSGYLSYNLSTVELLKISAVVHPL